METIRTQGITRTEYIRYVYGENAEGIAKYFFENGYAVIYNSARMFTVTVTTEPALWVYLDNVFSMKPQYFNDYSIS